MWEALQDAYPQINEFDRMLFFTTGKQVMQIAAMAAAFPDAVFDIIMLANREGWVATLIEGAYKNKPQNPPLRDFVIATIPDALVTAAGAGENGGDPLAACFLGSDRSLAFIGRDELRNGLRQLTAEGRTPRILSIYSELSRCGKTYSAELIRYAALHRHDRMAYLDLQQEISLGSGLQDLVAQLGRKIQADISTIPPQEAQTARWTRNLVIWLIDQVKRSEDFWWLVLDGVNQVEGLPDEINGFLDRLAKEIEFSDFDPPCRLVLISYDGHRRLPVDVRHRVVQEVIRDEIGPEEMETFFQEQIKRLIGENEEGSAAAAAADLVEAVTSKLQELPQEERPFAISSVVRDALRRLEASLVEAQEDGEPVEP